MMGGPPELPATSTGMLTGPGVMPVTGSGGCNCSTISSGCRKFGVLFLLPQPPVGATTSVKVIVEPCDFLKVLPSAGVKLQTWKAELDVCWFSVMTQFWVYRGRV